MFTAEELRRGLESDRFQTAWVIAQGWIAKEAASGSAEEMAYRIARWMTGADPPRTDGELLELAREAGLVLGEDEPHHHVVEGQAVS